MNARLVKQWEVVAGLLAEAASQVSSLDGYSQYQEYVGHNEFELALNVLEDLGEQASVNAAFWQSLKKAAEVMGLQSHYTALRQKVRACRAAG